MRLSRKTVASLSILALATTSSVRAGELSGSFSLDANSHFISYGFDVWGAGGSPDWVFNPSLGIDYKINDNWSLSTGFWLDVNDNASDSFEVVETDVWLGASYTAGMVTTSLTFQNWQYGGKSEEVLDLTIAFDTVLSPSLTLHKRLDGGAARTFNQVPDPSPSDPDRKIDGDIQLGGFNGTFAVLNLEHGVDLSDDFSISFPFALGVALDEFHTKESGYGFASLGVQGSLALSETTAFNFGATYYDTDDKVVGNAKDSFFTYNAGMSFSF